MRILLCFFNASDVDRHQNLTLILFFVIFFLGVIIFLPTVTASPKSAMPDSTVPQEQTINPPPKTPGVKEVGNYPSYLSRQEFLLSGLVIIFGFFTIFLEFLLMRKKSFNADEVLKVLAVTLIVISTLFVITAGLSGEQFAPAIGLFGTIAGYLLGRSERSGNQKDE